MKKAGYFLLLIFLVALVGYVDFVTPYEWSMALLYFIPVVLTARRFSMRAVLAMSFFAGLTWFAADYFSNLSPLRQFTAFALCWIGLIKVGTLCVVGYAVLRNAESKRSLEESNRELKAALQEIQELRNIIPVCSWCKSIRNDKGYYEAVESYLKRVTGSDLTHTICPSCAKKLEEHQ